MLLLFCELLLAFPQTCLSLFFFPLFALSLLRSYKDEQKKVEKKRIFLFWWCPTFCRIFFSLFFSLFTRVRAYKISFVFFSSLFLLLPRPFLKEKTPSANSRKVGQEKTVALETATRRPMSETLTFARTKCNEAITYTANKADHEPFFLFLLLLLLIADPHDIEKEKTNGKMLGGQVSFAEWQVIAQYSFRVYPAATK